MAKKKEDSIEELTTTGEVTMQELVVVATITRKQELENLYAEMTRLGVTSLGHAEVKISQQK